MAYAYLQTTQDTSDQSTYTFSSQNFGTASSDRYIIIGIAARKAGAATTISSVTIGGVSATIVAEYSNSDTNSNISALAIANVPTGTTGDVVVVFGATMVRCVITAWSATNLSSATPHDTLTNGSADPTGTIDVPAGGFAVATALSNSVGTVTWTGLTEHSDTTLETFVTVSDASDEFETAQTNMTVTANFSTSGSTPVMSVASWGVATNPNISVADEITITDYWTGYYQDTIDISENVTVVLSEATTSLSINVFDDITITENVSPKPTLRIQVNDVVDVASTSLGYVRIPTYYPETNDFVTITESVSLTLINYLSSYEEITISEASIALLISFFINIDFFDEIAVSDDSTVLTHEYVDANDAVSITEDVIVLLPTIYVESSDSITITDESVMDKFDSLRLVDVFDEITTTEDLVVLIKQLYVLGDDAITLTEAVTVQEAIYVDVNEFITLTEDSITVIQTLYIDVSDSFTITETIDFRTYGFITSNEDVLVTEDVVVFIPKLYVLTDEQITITESATIVVGSSPPLNVDIYDDVILIEDSTVFLPRLVFISNEDIALTEDVVVIVNQPVTPTIDTSDSITITEDSQVILNILDMPDIDVNDGITLIEDLVVLINDLYVSGEDTITTTELVTVLIRELFIESSDEVTLTDDTQVEVPSVSSYSIDVGQFIHVVDYLPRQYEDLVLVGEGIGVLILDAEAIIHSIDVSDQVTITEDPTVLITNVAPVSSETIEVLDDSTVLIRQLYVFGSDDVTISEAVTVQEAIYANSSESITVVENASVALLNLYIHVEDYLTITEDITAEKSNESSYSINVGQFIHVVDYLPREYEDLILVGEGVDVAILIPDETLRNVNASDSVTITENVGIYIPNLYVSVSENITVTEYENLFIQILINVLDSIALVDVVDVGKSLSIDVEDAISATDTFEVLIRQLNINVNDQVILTDYSEITDQGIRINTSDSINVLDSVNLVIGGTRNVTTYDQVGQVIPELIFVEFQPAIRIFDEFYIFI